MCIWKAKEGRLSSGKANRYRKRSRDIPFLDLLLADKSTKRNIIWATDTYEELGHGFTDKEQIDAKLLLQHADIIKPRIQKSQEEQVARTRKKAEVFTPAWLCNLMNNYCDEDWFGRKNVFNTENDDHTWTVTEAQIEFPKRKTWKHYVLLVLCTLRRYSSSPDDRHDAD